MPDVVRILLVVAVVVVLVARRLRGEPLQPMRVFVLPLVFLAIGVIDFAKSGPGHIGLADVAFIAAGTLLALGFGVGRGLSVGLFERDGYLWYRYRPLTLVLWLLLAGLRVLLLLGAHAADARVASAHASLMLVLGFTLAAEAAVLGIRAFGSGVPYAPAGQHARIGGAGVLAGLGERGTGRHGGPLVRARRRGW